MSHWIRVSPPLQENEHAEGGIITRREISPYEVPIAFRATVDKHHIIVIEFKYLDRDEPPISIQKNLNVKLDIGQHSNRLLAICISTKPGGDLGFKELSTTLKSDLVKSAFRRLKQEAKSESSKENYEIAERIVDSQKDAIVQELLAG